MYYIGVDLGGTSIKAGIVNKEGKIIKYSTIPTLPKKDFEIIEDIANLCKKLISESNISIEKFEYIGIGSPGVVNSFTKEIIYSSNINFKNTNLAKEMAKHIDLDIYLENDANCATIGEFYSGSLKGCNNGVMLTIGTGIGGGIIINKKIYKSSLIGEAELGHTIVDYSSDLKCGCGQKGCLEVFASANSIVNNAKNLIKQGNDSKILDFAKEIENINAKYVFEAYENKDKIALEVINNFYKYLSIGILNFINIFNPDIISIGGGVSARGESLTKPLEKIVRELIYDKNFKTKIVPAILGNNAGIIGAAMINKVN